MKQQRVRVYGMCILSILCFEKETTILTGRYIFMTRKVQKLIQRIMLGIEVKHRIQLEYKKINKCERRGRTHIKTEMFMGWAHT